MYRQLDSVRHNAAGTDDLAADITLDPPVAFAEVCFHIRNAGAGSAYVVATAVETTSAIEIVGGDALDVGPYLVGHLPFLVVPAGGDVWVTPAYRGQ